MEGKRIKSPVVAILVTMQVFSSISLADFRMALTAPPLVRYCIRAFEWADDVRGRSSPLGFNVDRRVDELESIIPDLRKEVHNSKEWLEVAHRYIDGHRASVDQFEMENGTLAAAQNEDWLNSARMIHTYEHLSEKLPKDEIYLEAYKAELLLLKSFLAKVTFANQSVLVTKIFEETELLKAELERCRTLQCSIDQEYQDLIDSPLVKVAKTLGFGLPYLILKLDANAVSYKTRMKLYAREIARLQTLIHWFDPNISEAVAEAERLEIDDFERAIQDVRAQFKRAGNEAALRVYRVDLAELLIRAAIRYETLADIKVALKKKPDEFLAKAKAYRKEAAALQKLIEAGAH